MEPQILGLFYKDMTWGWEEMVAKGAEMRQTQTPVITDIPPETIAALARDLAFKVCPGDLWALSTGGGASTALLAVTDRDHASLLVRQILQLTPGLLVFAPRLARAQRLVRNWPDEGEGRAARLVERQKGRQLRLVPHG